MYKRDEKKSLMIQPNKLAATAPAPARRAELGIRGHRQTPGWRAANHSRIGQ